MSSTNFPFLMMTNQMTIITFQENMSRYNHLSARKSKEKYFKKSTYPRSNLNKHGHSNFPPFGIIERRRFVKIGRVGCLQSPPLE